MNRKKKGILGEVKAMSYLIENDYEVFLPFSDNGKVDFIIMKNNIVQKVSVKSTSEKSKEGSGYNVELRNISRRKESIVVTKLNSDIIDILIVYVIPEDKIIFLNTKDIKGKTRIVVHLPK